MSVVEFGRYEEILDTPEYEQTPPMVGALAPATGDNGP